MLANFSNCSLGGSVMCSYMCFGKDPNMSREKDMPQTSQSALCISKYATRESEVLRLQEALRSAFCRLGLLMAQDM